MRVIWLFILTLLLGACATTIHRSVMGERGIPPKEVAQHPDSVSNRVFEWGGVIVEPKNLRDSTELQILAYPLRKDGAPNLDKNPTGRFIAKAKGYLEPADYAAGRQVTLSGHLKEIRIGKVGQADYAFPVLEADEILLWPLPKEDTSRTGVHFGFGAGSGGWSGGSIGIGIGF